MFKIITMDNRILNYEPPKNIATDMMGNILNKGDVLISKNIKNVLIYEFTGNVLSSSGIKYNEIGNPKSFSHISIEGSIKIDFNKLDPRFRYLFYHGMSNISTTSNSETDYEDIISKSNWHNQIKKIDILLEKNNPKIITILPNKELDYVFDKLINNVNISEKDASIIDEYFELNKDNNNFVYILFKKDVCLYNIVHNIVKVKSIHFINKSTFIEPIQGLSDYVLYENILKNNYEIKTCVFVKGCKLYKDYSFSFPIKNNNTILVPNVYTLHNLFFNWIKYFNKQ